MPNYIYINLRTGQKFQVNRPMIDSDKPYYDYNNQLCQKELVAPWLGTGKCQVWQKDSAYVQKMNPKFVKTRDGKRIKYNPLTMGGPERTVNHKQLKNGLPQQGRQGQQIFVNNKWWKWDKNKWKLIKEKQ